MDWIRRDRILWTVAAVGVLSMVLLLWTSQIHERERTDFERSDTLMDIQINTATAHVWLEEVEDGDPVPHGAEALAALDQARRLADVMLQGGISEHGSLPTPLKAPELRARAEEIRNQLAELDRAVRQRLLQIGTEGRTSREWNHDPLFKQAMATTRALEESIEVDKAHKRTAGLRLTGSLLGLWISFLIVTSMSLWRYEKRRRESRLALVEANEQLALQADELSEHRTRLTELVEARTTELSESNELLREEIEERKRTEQALKHTEQHVRHLSSRLLMAQEVERRRISMELHDELGQSLNVIKLQIKIIETGLHESQGEARESCEQLLDFLGQLIDEMRRISLALSPTVLEDLGLTAALRWLVSNFSRDPDVKVTLQISDVDPLIPEEHRIVVYRVLQEALTNVGRHSRASNVMVVAEPEGFDQVIFAVEDDGRGFDPAAATSSDSNAAHFGLTTMSERVAMIGGRFHIRTRPDHGTRVSFSLPVARAGT